MILTPMIAARAHLRHATRTMHERTDAAFSDLDLALRDDYGVFLASHWLAYTALEPVFAAKLPAAQRPPAMAYLLYADLTTLAIARPVSPIPVFDGDALGAAYVVAGSHFGKRILSRRHGKAQDGQVRAACRYLGSPEMTAYWSVLLEAITGASADDPARLGRMVEGADAAFALFAACLEQVKPR